jgi:hypothetical protein
MKPVGVIFSLIEVYELTVAIFLNRRVSGQNKESSVVVWRIGTNRHFLKAYFFSIWIER